MAIDPLTAGLNFGTKALDLVSEWIEDPDKKVQIMFEMAKLNNAFQVSLVQMQTNPWVDGGVKLLYALRDITRPLGAMAMTAFGSWLSYKGVIEADQVNDTAAIIGAGMSMALPAWGTSRHLHKAQAEREETKREQYRAISKAGSEAPESEHGMFEH